jgi:hypothetical protein
MSISPPSDTELEAALGSASVWWSGIVAALGAAMPPLETEWRPSKLAFGRMCLLRHKKRTLLYLIPDDDGFLAAVVLGERACGLALAGSIPAAIKRMIADARPYAEGRGIRFPVRSLRDVKTAVRLVEFKTMPPGRT